MSQAFRTVEELETQIGKAPALVRLKTIDHLDEGALRWVTASPLMFASFGDGSATSITIGGGEPGWAYGNARELHLNAAMLDDPDLARPGVGFGSLFVLPTITEVLRVNGTVSEVCDGVITVTVQECYFHCGKALIRSAFWAASPVPPVLGAAPESVAAFVAASRFMALATTDPQGNADLSPKGDAAAQMARLGDERLWFADRPGNKRFDSFRNIVAQPRVAALLLIPGCVQVVSLSGTASISSDETRRAIFTVQDKAPALVTGIDDLVIELRLSPALARARLWPVSAAPKGVNPTTMMLAHLKLNKNVAAKLAGTLMAVPGLMRKGLDQDYKKNLY